MAWAWLCGGRLSRAPAHEVVLYTRQGCHLCTDAWELLTRLQGHYSYTLRAVDVDADPALAAAHGECVPVVAIDGRVRFRGVVHPVLLRRVLAARPEPS